MYTDLTIGAILRSGVLAGRDMEIVYRDEKRMDYREFGERVRRLASGLAFRGVVQGDVVAVLDWDTHRYLECYFAVPMMGAVLQTVNLRMAPEQIIFCLAAARASVLLVNGDFLPLIADARPCACGSPMPLGVRLHLRSRTRPVFEGRWCCSPACLLTCSP